MQNSLKQSVKSMLLAIALVLPCLLQAQTISILPVTVNNTGPFINNWKLFAGGGTYSGIYSNVQFRVTVQGGFTNPIELDAVGAPSGVTVTFSPNLFTNTQTITMLVCVTNVAKGTYPLSIQASNIVSSATYSSNVVTMIFGTLWANNNPAAVSWNNAGNWTAGIPANGDDVLFQDGTDTNYLDYSVALASLTYLRNSNTFSQYTALAPGVTLSVIGTNGFAANVQSLNANTKTTTINIGGSSTLIVSNRNSIFTVNNLSTGGSGTTFIMTNLNNFTANVSRFGLGDVGMAEEGSLGPNFVNVSLAMTNVIFANYVSDYTVTNALTFAVSLFRNGDDYNNGSAEIVNLGLSNSIVADSFGMGQGRAGGVSTLRFSPIFTNIAFFPKPYLYVRGTNGGRMTLFAIGVDSGVNASGSNARGIAFLNNGTVDLLADQMWMGRTRYTNLPAGQDAGTFTMNDGNANVNRLILGYQPWPTNDSFAVGTLNVGGTGSFTVNSNLDMGWVAGFVTPTGTGSGHGASQGSIGMTGGKIFANNITVGGITNDNGNCTITLSSGELVVSNTIASASRSLNTLTVNGGRLTLLLNGNHGTDPYVYLGALSVPTGVGSELRVASAIGYTYPTNIPLILVSGAATLNFSNYVMPSGLHGTLIVDVNNSHLYNLQVLANVPKNLVWRGYTDNTWSTSPSKTNWLDLGTGLHTNYDNGDFVTFDDNGSVPTTISVVDPSMTPASILVTNTVNHYTFNNGGGFLVGGATLTKVGTNALDINFTTGLNVQVNEGIFTGNGTVSSLSVAAGATANYAGTILTGFNCAGTATLSGNGAGGMTILSGGSVTQIGNFAGQFSLAPNAQLYNQGNLNGIVNSTTGTNSLLSNSGNMSGGGLTIGGTYIDNGSGQLSFSNVTTINGNGVFRVGNADGNAQVTINSSFSSTFLARGRVLFSNGSTNYFGVNTDNGHANQLISFSVDFGNNNTLAGGGGVIVITNVGATPFAAGQTFTLFQNNQFDPNDTSISEAGTNTAPIIRPASPGPGLAWDTRTLRTNGVINVITVGTSLPAYTFSPVITNNLVTILNMTTNSTNSSLITTNFSTNKAIISTLTWPSTNVGWRLQQQIDLLTVGIRGGDSNWTYVYPSWWTNSILVTNNFNPTNAVFFRLTYP